MKFIQRILCIISILIFIKSYLCQHEQYLRILYNDINNTDILSSNATLTLDNALTEDSFNSSNFIPETIIEYSSTIDIPKKYITAEEDYTSIESIAFSILTNQQISKTITILAGIANENISYAFNIENGRLKFTFSQDNLPEVVLTTKNDTNLINNGQWHRLYIERSNRKLRYTLDNVEQSDNELSDKWQERTNIFIGAQLTIVPDSNYNGKIDDIIVSNANRSLNLREGDISDENFEDSIITTISLAINQSELIQTIAFLPNDNNEIIFPSPIKSFFKTFSFLFRTYSNHSTLIQFGEIHLNIDIDGYLTLVIRDQSAQRIFSNEKQKPINDGKLYFVQLELNNQTLKAWINTNKKISIQFSTSYLIIENFIFGLHNQFIGCIENVTYNNEIFSFEDISLNRQQCFLNDITIKSIYDISIDQIISFKENDRPLIITFDYPEEFHMFSLFFSTQESNSIICSLADSTYENFIILSIRHEYLFLTYYNKRRQPIEISINNLINDKNEHKITVKLINQNYLLFELDENTKIENVFDIFYINTIYIGKLDHFIKEQLSNFNGDDFIGCIKNVMLNKKSLIELKHIYPLDRLASTCQNTIREPKNVISYISSDVSFSIRDYHDIIELQIPSNDEFYECQIAIKTQSLNGIIASIYSNDDNYGLILSLKEGKLQLHYYLSHNMTLLLIFNDNETINDGQEHYILIFRQFSNKNMYIKIDNRTTNISNLSSLSLFFDVITIGGSDRIVSDNLFVGCFANITYNHHPLLPEGIVKSDRYDCFCDQGSICDRQMPCNSIQPLQFCGQTDCSLVCTSSLSSSSLIHMNNKGSLRYFTQIESGQYEQIYLMIFTISDNSVLFTTENGSIQVSIVIQNYYPRLIIRNGGIIYTYDFPGRVRGDQWHVLQCQKTINTIDLTFDDETRHYTYFIEYFSLFGDRKIYLCGKNFIGYVQDIIFMADNHHENLIHNSIRNPGLIDYDPSVLWNNHANIPEPEAAPPPSSQYETRSGGSMPCYFGCWTPCERIQCLNGGYCIQPASPTSLAYCHCPSQYTGYRCEQSVDPCSNYLCNHGSCQKDRTSQPYCSCYEGYGGPRCDTQIDACTRISCNYGTCISEGTSYRCQCHQGYEGSACDRQIDPCSNFVCHNGGLCRTQENRPVCQCTLGYRGTNCYEIDDPCSHYDCYGGSCKTDHGLARCICPTGRTGSHCEDDICVLYPCANHGQCIPEGVSRRCVCPSPYYGDDCREYPPANPCENVYCGYGQCREGACICYTGYTGPTCEVPPDLCANINCYHGTCHEGRCICYEEYTGPYCEISSTTTPIITTTIITTTTTTKTLRAPQPILAKTGKLIDYGRVGGPRLGPIGWILALVSGLLLLPLALAFAARQCTGGGCIPPARPISVPVSRITTQPGVPSAKTIPIDIEVNNLAAAADEMETTRIEQTREVVREYSGMDTATGIFTNYPTMSSRYGDFARDNQQQQTSSSYSQQHIIETDYHAPPVADFGYVHGGVTEGYRDTVESWEGVAGGAAGYSMNAMFADGGLQTDYELSNITSISMTPNGKYAIVGQSQGPPQIWDALNGQLVSSMHGTSTNCIKVGLACNGTLLVGLASDGIDTQTNILQIWDVNTGKPVQLTHQIKCATFTLTNDSNNLVMAGNQKYGRGISVGILDLNNSELIKEIKSDTNQSYGGTPTFIALTSDERYAIVGCPMGASTNYVVFDITTQHELVQPPMITIDSDPKCSLVLNNEQMLTGTRNGQVILWSIPSCQRLGVLNDNGQNAHRDRITDIKLSPDRSYFVTSSADATAKVWNSNSKELVSRLVGHSREITCVCVSTNQLVTTGSRDQNICLWRILSGQLASTMPVNMTPLDIHMAAHNRTVVAIGEKDGERQLLMLRVLSTQR
ncbi:unnamed protein product [Rotaria sp. Silwood1]|nr:unnamed protein product [Rotaria sp. Silwood1]CAF3538327.1 unnamed protein product [Rotaria sp. Silwood1]CAF4510336.1 unnamed protein product [Rotaria sp. Silwood1]CAF4561008.1 unnamed protein product [Rotaria sp. Silwood1]